MEKKALYREYEQRIEELEEKILELQQAGDKLEEGKRLYQGLAQNVDAGISMIDTRYNIIWSNRSAVKWFAKSHKEVIGNKCYEEFEKRKEPCPHCPGAVAMATGQPREVESQGVRDDGTRFAVTNKAYPLYNKDGEIIGFQEFVRDISERKAVEKTLRESEDKYRTIIENIEENYFEVDVAGNLTFFNDSVCQTLGYPRDELMGMNNRQYTDEENSKKLYNAFNRVYKTGGSARVEYDLIKKDGSIIQMELSTSLIKNGKGEPVGFRGIARDVTERKRAEEAKRKFEKQLTYAQRMESIGTLAGGIAHNFNNLLMGIQGNASIMLFDIDENSPHHKNLKNIEDLVKNGSKLTAQLIGYARKGRYEVKPISLNQLIMETSDTFSSTRKEIIVHRDLAENLYGIHADPDQINQVLLNLYVNAADALPEGGDLFLKTINVTHEHMAGKPYEPKQGNYVLLTVRDTGIGMEKETMDRIFEPFFTTKGLASGTGLGLASAYGIIKGHGGYIDVESENGKGTTFSIYLPGSGEIIREEQELQGEPANGGGVILLVDDEDIVLETGEGMLKRLGYDVLTAKGGRKAIDLYIQNQDKIDMVLVDMVMPGMGGGKTFDRLKEINSNIKVLLSSGYSIDGEAKEILDRGCDGFIQKPFDMKQLSRSIGGILHSDGP